jgi:large subunit ribosomal protein L1
MPNPKVGTVTFEIGKAVRETKAGRVEFRVDKAGIVHAPVGRISFEQDKLIGNIHALMDQIMRLKPASAKGVYLQAATLSSTMGPGIKLDTNLIQPKASN